ncbi:MAG: hypothetical protein V3V35_09315, partial [Dehalococcoidia bacterium]
GPSAPTPAPDTPSPSQAAATSTPPAQTPTPASTPANPDNVEAQVPIPPGAEPASVEGEPRIAGVAIDPDDYNSIFEAQYLLTSVRPIDTIDFYKKAMALAPYNWETFDVIGGGLLFRAIVTKQDGRYVAWVMVFAAPSEDEPTRILIDVGEKMDTTGSGAGPDSDQSGG